MDLYHSRLTQDDLNDLIVKYKIPRDLHPRLPFEEFVMPELLDDAIGNYRRMFDFFSVRIPFSLFLLALIKHYRVHFSQMGPLGLNKGDWFSFAKHRAPSPVCIDDNRSCMKHWKSGFFLNNQRDILDSMVWRHPIAAIDTDFSGDAIHTDFFPFSAGPYYATYPKGGVAGNCEFTREVWDALYQPTFGVLTKEVFKDPAVCKNVVDQFPTPREMVQVKSFSDDQLTTKMSVLHYMMMSHDADSRLKGYDEKVASLTGLELQVSILKKHVSRLNDKLSSSDASFAKSKAKGKERKKNIKSLTRSLDNLHAEGELLSLAASAGFERGLSMHWDKDEFAAIFEFSAEPLSVILQLEPEKLVHPANIPTSRDARVSPPIAKVSTVTPAFESLELSGNIVPAPSAVAFEKNEEWLNAMVDGPDVEMTDGATHSKSGGVFVQGTSHVLDDVTKVSVEGSGRVSSGLTDVVIALFAGEKGDDSFPYSIANKEAIANPSRV
ncbi:hypothetical protein Tco_0438233 [Tanacetum coccineum]